MISLKRSVYSLVLMDDIIRAVDREACKRGTSRSNLINQILAEHLSCCTPEMRMREIFGSLSDVISGSFRIQQQRSASLMTLRTALEYKYRPTINYKVELERAPDVYLGTLRVSIRTQSGPLIALFNDFFAYRSRLETALLRAMGCTAEVFSPGSGSFSRRLINSGASEEHTGEAISRYLNNLNQSIQAYFTGPEVFHELSPELEAEFAGLTHELLL